jgi:putative DNA primase/helicase
VNYAEIGKLYVFSSNAAPFVDGRSYDKFGAYALLNHGGDVLKAAAALRAEGYGPQELPAGRRIGPGNVTTTVLRVDE